MDIATRRSALTALRGLLLVAATAIPVAAHAQTGTVSGTLGTITSTTTTILRDTALALPTFRINPTAGTTSFQAAIVHQGLTRVFYVIQPSAAVANAPALFLLHGRGMTGDRMANYTTAGRLARDYGAWVILPNAAGSNGEWSNDPSVTTGPDDVAFLDTLRAAVIAQYALDPRRIYFAGLSSGGFMAQLMACRSSYAIAAIFSVAAAVRNSVRPVCTATRPLPVGLIHGTSDPIVPYDGIAAYTPNTPPNLTSAPDTAEFWATRNACTLSPVEMLALPDVANDTTTVSRRTYQGCASRSPVVLYTVTNGGHTWPGTPFETYTVGLGPTTQDIDATTLAWSFLSPFSLP